jgi:uncharacterized protein YbaR (Trm112 family)
MNTTLEPRLLELIKCPCCPEGRLALVDGGERLRCEECGRIYPIVDHVPDLLPGEDAEVKESGGNLCS